MIFRVVALLSFLFAAGAALRAQVVTVSYPQNATSMENAAGVVDAIAATITAGVSQPKQYRAPMPAMGGAQLSADQVSALAAYVWGMSHRSSATAMTSGPKPFHATAVDIPQ